MAEFTSFDVKTWIAILMPLTFIYKASTMYPVCLCACWHDGWVVYLFIQQHACLLL